MEFRKKAQLWTILAILVFFIEFIAFYLLGFFPAFASAATISEDFESYTNGTAINGLSGGSGWAGAWVSDGFTVSNTYNADGSKSAHDSGSSYFASRSFGEQLTGTAVIYARYQTWGGLGADLYNSGGTVAAHLYCDGSNWKYYNGSTYSTLGTCAQGTWYKLSLEWDAPNHPNQVRYQVDSGGWTSWVTVLGSTYTYISSLRISNGGDWLGYSYWDAITISTPEGGGITPDATATAATSTESFMTVYGIMSLTWLGAFFFGYFIFASWLSK